MMELRNLMYNADGVTIDCELNHPSHGWVPFTVSPDDRVRGEVLYAEIMAGDHGEVASYVARVATPEGRAAEIRNRLREIDWLSIRALRAKSAGRGQAQDDAALGALEDEAELLRAELAGL